MSIARYLADGRLGVSPWRLRCEELAGKPGVLNLGAGDPDLATPTLIQEAADAAVRAGRTHYAPTQGLPELRDAICRRYARCYGVTVTPDQVQVTTGGANALFTAVLALVEPGDRVVVVRPSLEMFISHVRMAGALPMPVDLTATPDGFRLDLAALRAAARGARMIIVNFPNNPTGAVLPAADYAELVAIAADNDAYLVSDEVYDELIYHGETPQTLLQWPYAKTLVVNSFSKTYAMTGWRLGWVIAPSAARPRLTQCFGLSVSHANTPVQVAGTVALDEGQQAAAALVAEMARRRDALYAALAAVPGLRPMRPAAGLYVFCDVSGTGMDGDGFCKWALNEHAVLTFPGANFGPGWERYVRFSFAAAPVSVAAELVRRLGPARTAGRSRL